MRYCTGKLALCLVIEVRERKECFSLEKPTPTSRSVSFLFSVGSRVFSQPIRAMFKKNIEEVRSNADAKLVDVCDSVNQASPLQPCDSVNQTLPVKSTPSVNQASQLQPCDSGTVNQTSPLQPCDSGSQTSPWKEEGEGSSPFQEEVTSRPNEMSTTNMNNQVVETPSINNQVVETPSMNNPVVETPNQVFEAPSPLDQFGIHPILDLHMGNYYFSFTNPSLSMLLTLVLVLVLLYVVTKKGGGKSVPNAWQSLVELIYDFVPNLVNEQIGGISGKHIKPIGMKACRLVSCVRGSFTSMKQYKLPVGVICLGSR